MVILYKLEWYCDNFDKTKNKIKLLTRKKSLIRYKQLKKGFRKSS